MGDDVIEAVLDGDESVSDLDDEEIDAMLDEIEDTVERIDSTIESLSQQRQALQERAEELRTFQMRRELFPEDAIENLSELASTLQAARESEGLDSSNRDEQ
ncbi:hypothetical protein [Halorussus salinus]|uniref:hypothetical protein n=1 Tax=Halorussus salinus TaxID=1364935 RepID=UPI001092A055|nr:hypothetical protein [Halorussus salinus]